MRVIDLLNKIANGEEVPKNIKYKNETLTFDKEINNYIYDSGKDEYWTDYFIIHLNLNDEVEIIEEDKEIEEVDVMFPCDKFKGDVDGFIPIYNSNLGTIKRKLNELIKAVNELKKGK